uniref:Uncharacterized protein n=1 Tax=Arundo donax TaxID=35708 RepID=A0A0A9H506_ARUDO
MDKVTPTNSEHLRISTPRDHPDLPCLALPYPQKRHGRFLSIRKILGGIKFAKDLILQMKMTLEPSLQFFYDGLDYPFDN